MRFGLAGDSYREFAVQERLLEEDWRVRPPSEEERFDPSLIWILGVKGWIVARDGRGEEHVLIARRGAQTRIYGMGWECAPAGGIDVAEGHAGELPVAGTAFDLAGAIERTLREEAREELGMDLEAMEGLWVAAKAQLRRNSD